MTVAVDTRRESYTGDGVTTGPFTVTFPFFEVQVFIDGELVDDGDYTITQSAPGQVGDIDFDTAPDGTVVIIGATEAAQQIDFISVDDVEPETAERALDRLTMIAQEHDQLFDHIGVDLSRTRQQVFPTLEGNAGQSIRVNDAEDGWDYYEALTQADMDAIQATADQATATLTTYKRKFLGAKSSNPVLDDAGLALTSGALYWNTSSEEFRLYDAGVWVALPEVGEADERINVKHPAYGAAGDGATDDTTAILAAITAAAASPYKTAVYFPPGIYKVSSVITIPPYVQIIGSGKYSTYIRSSSATADILLLDGYATAIRDLSVDSSVAKTAGRSVGVTSNAGNIEVRNVRIKKPFVGLSLPTPQIALARLFDIDIEHAKDTDGVSFDVLGGYVILCKNIVCNSTASFDSIETRPNAHYNIHAVEDIYFVDCQALSGGTNWNIAPANGQTVSLVYILGGGGDNCPSTPCIRIVPTGTGVVEEVYVNVPWLFGFPDILANATFGGGIESLTVADSMLVGTGVGIEAVGVDVLRVFRNRVGNHTIALYAEDCGGGQVQHNLFGPHGDYIGNVTAIELEGATNNMFIDGNDLRGNSNAIVKTTLSGTGNIVKNNPGYRAGPAGITVGASPYTYTAGITPEVVYLNGGTVSLVKHNGTSVHLATNVTLVLEPGDTVTVTYSVLPNMVSVPF